MEERILNALAGSPGKSAKEVARELGESTPIIMEHLLGLAASGSLNQRTVGREQVFSVPRKSSVPTPREIAPGNWFQPGPPHTTLPASVTVWECCKCHHRRADMPGDPFGPCEQCGTASGLHGIYSPDPALTGPSIKELIDAGQLPPAAWPESVPMFAMVPDEAIAPTRAWSLEKPTLYDRIGGTITLEIGDSPIKARFQSVEQLHRFLTELIETERAGQVPEKGQV